MYNVIYNIMMCMLCVFWLSFTIITLKFIVFYKSVIVVVEPIRLIAVVLIIVARVHFFIGKGSNRLFV